MVPNASKIFVTQTRRLRRNEAEPWGESGTYCAAPNLQPGSELLFLTQHAAQELMDTDHGPSSRQAAENAYRTTIQRTESRARRGRTLDYLI